MEQSRPGDELLHVDVSATESLPGLVLRRREQRRQLRFAPDHPHAPAAASRHRLDHHRIADAGSGRLGLFFRADDSVRTGEHRQAGGGHLPPGAVLLAHQADEAGAGPDEGDAGGFADFGEAGAFGQEAVAGMDGVGAGDFSGADEAGDVQVAVGRARGPDADRLVGKAHGQRVAVGLRVDRHRLRAQLFAGVDDAQRDLAAVGNEDFVEHGSGSGGATFSSRGGWRTAARRIPPAGRSPRRCGRPGRRRRLRFHSSASWLR